MISARGYASIRFMMIDFTSFTGFLKGTGERKWILSSAGLKELIQLGVFGQELSWFDWIPKISGRVPLQERKTKSVRVKSKRVMFYLT